MPKPNTTQKYLPHSSTSSRMPSPQPNKTQICLPHNPKRLKYAYPTTHCGSLYLPHNPTMLTYTTRVAISHVRTGLGPVEVALDHLISTSHSKYSHLFPPISTFYWNAGHLEDAHPVYLPLDRLWVLPTRIGGAGIWNGLLLVISEEILSSPSYLRRTLLNQGTRFMVWNIRVLVCYILLTVLELTIACIVIWCRNAYGRVGGFGIPTSVLTWRVWSNLFRVFHGVSCICTRQCSVCSYTPLLCHPHDVRRSCNA
jgi:hypothetical protein